MTTFEKTWQFQTNVQMDASSTTANYKNMVWWFKSFLKGDGYNNASYTQLSGSALTSFQGLWTTYYSCDGTTAGTAGDGIDRWGTQGSTTGNTGSAASLVTGATVTGAIRLTGVTGLASSLGNYVTITGAATSANNSPTNTPFKIVKVNSATDVEIYNPSGVTGDANNGAISWTERGQFTFTAANIVNNTTGSAHSWYILKSPPALGPYYFFIDVNTSGILNLSLAFSKTAPTGGSTTSRPTSVDEVQLATWNNTQGINNTQTTGRMHGGLATDGNFHIMSSYDGLGNFYSTTIFQVLADTKSLDNYTAHMYYRGSNNQPTFTNLINNSGYFGGRSRNGAVVLNTCGTTWTYTNGGVIFSSFLTTTDFTDSTYDDLPIYIYTQTVGYKSIRGRFYDYRWVPNNISNGTVESSQSSPTSVVDGNLWIPYNAVPII